MNIFIIFINFFMGLIMGILIGQVIILIKINNFLKEKNRDSKVMKTILELIEKIF